MKLNNKGFAISSIMYLILVMALLLVAILLGLLNSRKNILDTQKRKLINSLAAEPVEPLSKREFYYSKDGNTYEFGQEYVVPKTGLYKIELWGAQGGGTAGGKGAYTSGLIELEKGTILYFYVGAQGNTFNGGGSSSVASRIGGGATDVRLINGLWNNNQSLISRIMVAAGGGSVTDESSGAKAGVGGTLEGIKGLYHSATSDQYTGKGGTQTAGGAGGTSASNGAFGVGGSSGTYTDGHVGSGGGGGYYGGGGSTWHTGSGGGSSFVSGFIGCVNINNNTPIYTDYVFSNPEMKAGNENMPSKTGTDTMTGNSGDGFAKITYISS